MDDALRQSMLRYYDQRAPDYDEAYLRGTGTSSIRDANVFQREAKFLEGVVERTALGRIIDLACGTGFWLQHYVQHCSQVTLVDQSASMLAECQKRVATLGVAERCSLVHADVFEHDFGVHDFALVGFLLSHLDDEQESSLFGTLKRILGRPGRFLILDSAWGPERARFNAKTERQTRHLNDGTAFDIYKRYFDRADVAAWTDKYGVATSIEHFGTAFVAVSGQFTRDL
jgi:ubiquinone/menaquinone biosynthesis C-methylase UbiE